MVLEMVNEVETIKQGLVLEMQIVSFTHVMVLLEVHVVKVGLRMFVIFFACGSALGISFGDLGLFTYS
jgi:hypothetical protein